MATEELNPYESPIVAECVERSSSVWMSTIRDAFLIAVVVDGIWLVVTGILTFLYCLTYAV